MPQLAESSLPEIYAEASAAYEQAVVRRGAIERRLQIGTQRITLRCAGAALADALLGALSATGTSGRDGGTRIGLWSQSGAAPWPASEVGPRGLVRGSHSEGISAVHEIDSGVLTLVDAARSQILYCVLGVDRLPWWERAAPLRPALHFALSAPGRHLVHAAAVGDQERGGVLVAGVSGSGKSTLALAAVERGLRFVGDDYVLLENAVAWNIYGTAKVGSEPGREKTILKIASDSLIEALPIRAIVASQITAGRARLERVSAAEALLAIAPSTVIQMPFDRGAVVATLADLVRHVPCYRLATGSSPPTAAEVLDGVLSRD
jgi:hypothetical protein